jgi:para-nitrobenzyl esterase
MQDHNQTKIGRRSLFVPGAVLAGGAAAATLIDTGCGAKTEASSGPSGPMIIASDGNAVVETTGGKVRGFTRNGIQTFKGVPYAATAEGSGRFVAPAKPKPWVGIRSSMYYGPTCPQAPRTGWLRDENAFLFQWDDGQPGEDCLRMNLWTPGLDARKRPVMVWLHGGGWAAGSGQEQPAYNGENLSRRGEVVVVSLNHRLSILGYLNLAAYGDKYADSTNAGVLDLVAALEWVRDNIIAFGGDPGNVTIFGQSGGGGKVSTLASMPMAKGLFHKAVVQSGSTLRLGDAEAAAKLAAAVVAELGLSKATIDKIQTVPCARLLEAGDVAIKNLQPNPPLGGPGVPAPRGAAQRLGFSPVVDGKYVTRHPFDPDAPGESANVPMLIGTVMNEQSPSMFDAALESMTEDQMKERAARRYGGQTSMVVDAYRKAYPDVKPVELLSRMLSVRTNAVMQAERKAAKGSAPAYMYLFSWQTPVLNARPRAFHCSEIPFVFHNTDVSAFATGGTAEARELGAKVSDAWINFARHGDPNHGGLPKWPAFSAETGPVMIFDKTCEVKNDPDRELRKVVAAALG